MARMSFSPIFGAIFYGPRPQTRPSPLMGFPPMTAEEYEDEIRYLRQLEAMHELGYASEFPALGFDDEVKP